MVVCRLSLVTKNKIKNYFSTYFTREKSGVVPIANMLCKVLQTLEPSGGGGWLLLKILLVVCGSPV